MEYTAEVITVSDSGFAGEREDLSGPLLSEMLEANGWTIVHRTIVPDDFDKIAAELIDCADNKNIALVITTGGTGFSQRDITPEATKSVILRECPGIPEAMRAESMRITPRGMLSREASGIRGKTLIVNVPGSPKASKECLGAVIDSLKHGIEMLMADGSTRH